MSDTVKKFASVYTRRALHIARQARIWSLRWVISFLMLTGFLPAPLLLEWLRWLRKDMGALHPNLPEVLQEIAQLEQEARRG